MQSVAIVRESGALRQEGLKRIYLQGWGITEYFGRFIQILTDHVDESDSLSEELLRIGSEIAELIQDVGIDTLQSKLAVWMYRLGEALRSSFGGVSLREPVIEGGRVWEKWMLEDVRLLFEGELPCAEGERLEEERPHLFAQELIEWQNDLLGSKNDSLREFIAEVLKLRRDQEVAVELSWDEMLKMSAIKRSAKYAAFMTEQIAIESIKRVIKEVSEERIGLEQIKKAAEERTEVHLDRMKVDLLKREEEASKAIDGVSALYEKRIAGLEVDRDRALARERELYGRVCALEGRVSTLESHKEHLARRLADAEARINSLAASISSGGGGGGGCVVM